MITPADLRNPAAVSGYRHVGYNAQAGKSVPKPFQAYDSRSGGPTKKHRWKGPRRSSALEAAHDYCAYANSGAATSTSPLNYPASQKAKRDQIANDPEVQAALGVLRDARAQRSGRPGYVYCIGVKDDDYAVKIGYSVKPEARVAELQTGNPRELVLLAKMEGTLDDERAIHSRYIKLNLIGEWFRKSPALLNEFQAKNPAA